MSFRWRVRVGGTVGLLVAVATTGTALGAVQIVELSAQEATPGMVVTMRVAMTGRVEGTESAPLFLIPSGTFGDSPESMRCESVGNAIQVGETQWQAGTVEYEGETYAGVEGEATFTVPQVAADTYRLAESFESEGTGCHIFALIEVVAELPDTALLPIGPSSGVGQALPAGAGLLAIALVVARLRARPLGHN